MNQPSHYDLLRQAAECLEQMKEAEKQGDIEKAEALQAEARRLLQETGRAQHRPEEVIRRGSQR